MTLNDRKKKDKSIRQMGQRGDEKKRARGGDEGRPVLEQKNAEGGYDESEGANRMEDKKRWMENNEV